MVSSTLSNFCLAPVPTTTWGSKQDIEIVRKQFPALQKHAEIIFFDNASTTQKPESVLKELENFYLNSCANAGRASYSWSTQITQAIENTRSKVAAFLGAQPAEIAFTGGATDSLNSLVQAWALGNLKNGDEVMLSFDDHRSATLPWLNAQRLLLKQGIEIKIIPFSTHDVGDYDLKEIQEKVSPKTRVIQIAHIHHRTGMDMEVADIRKIVGKDCLISLDASQSVGHIPVKVDQLDVDFLSFSGHKMFAANGVGILWIKKELHNRLEPVRLGGGSTGSIKAGQFCLQEQTLASLMEAGTLNIPSILSLTPAIEFIETTGIANIEARLWKLTKYLYDGLNQIPGIEFGQGIGRCGCDGGYGIISFRFNEVSPADLAFLLDAEQIFVRAGDHCTGQEDKNNNRDKDYVRVSLHIYNTEEEADILVDVLQAAFS